MLLLSILFPPKAVLIIWVPLFHGYHCRQVLFHLQQQQRHMQSYPSPTSNSASPCSFHRKYPRFCSNQLTCNISAHSVTDLVLYSYLIIRTIYWSFRPHIVSLRGRTLKVYDYWSFYAVIDQLPLQLIIFNTSWPWMLFFYLNGCMTTDDQACISCGRKVGLFSLIHWRKHITLWSAFVMCE